jgi:ssDNA-binding Zn-finger/Zn-ribbon topoisomerase 1
MNELVISNEQQYLTPVTNINGALQRYQNMKDFVTGILREGVDFGVIPGTTKNTLLKPGAEKLTAFFGLAITYEVLEKVMDWMGTNYGGEPFFYFAYKVRLMRNGQIAGEGEGSCNSWEKKYRYRKGERKCPKCGELTIIKGKTEYGGGWLCYAKKGGCGAKFKDGDTSIEGQNVENIPNPDIADQVNTIQKIAQKRALVAATLNTVNASDWFTQDVEDFIEGGFEEAAPVVQAAIVVPEGASKLVPVKHPVFTLEEILEPMTIDDEVKPEPQPELISKSEKKPYAELEIPELTVRWNALSKSLKENHLSDEERADKEARKAEIKRLITAKRDGAK